MKWITKRGTNSVMLDGFMFFDTRLSITDDLERQQNKLLSELYLQCKNIVEYNDDNKLLADLSNYNKIRFYYTIRCNNIGNGKYKYKQQWKKYHWINGTFYPTNGPCNTFAIRYDITIPTDKVIEHGLIVLKRHCRRLIDMYHNYMRKQGWITYDKLTEMIYENK